MPDRIRILEVTATLRPAGAERIVVSLASGLDHDRFDVAVVSMFDAFDGGLENDLKPGNIPVWHLGKHPGPDLRMYPRLRSLTASFKPDVIHSHCYVTRYTFLLPAPVRIHTVHNLALRETDAFGRLINRYAFHRGLFPVGVGRAVTESVCDVYGLDHATTIPNGIDTRRFLRGGNRTLWREQNGFSQQDILIVSVARLDPQKNPVALAEAIRDIPEAHLVLVGDGELRSMLEGRPRVHLLGLRSDIPDILTASDIFALASEWEGLPLSVLEAMAAALPVVANSVGCLPDVVEHGISGMLLQPNRPHDLVEALRILVSSASMRCHMGEAARKQAEKFSLEAMVRSYEDLFVSLLSSRRHKLQHSQTSSL